MYDYLIVGAGLFGASFANLETKKGKKCLVIDKNDFVGGSIRTLRKDNIDIHLYGAHIFHTSNKEVWDFFSSFSKMNDFINTPLAYYKGKKYNLPFNMNTFNQLWGVTSPKQAKDIIEKQKKEANITKITNLEEQAISLVGVDVYNTLIKGYTQKQWGRKCSELDPSIIKRLPLRFEYNNNYFNDIYQGIPVDGYTKVIERMLEGSDVKLGVDFLKEKEEYLKLAKKVIYTGEIDKYFDYCFGNLEYRTLRFEIEKLNQKYYQEMAVINNTEEEVPYTRTIEHKHFNDMGSEVTYITREYPKEFEKGDTPYYPIQNERNASLLLKYQEEASKNPNIIFAGRLGQYKYFDMDDTIINAMELVSKLGD